MKYKIRLVIAATLIGFLICDISFWGFGLESKQSGMLAIAVSFAGLIVEWIRLLILKKKYKTGAFCLNKIYPILKGKL